LPVPGLRTASSDPRPWLPGGNPPQRPDQLLQPTSRAGVGPAPAGATVIARRVIVFGPGEGIFIYSGTPALGNLIGSWAGVAGVDQFGNSYPAGLDVDEGSLEVSDIIAQAMTLNPGPLLLYGNPNTVQVLLTGAGNWPAPAGVTSVFAETIGSGQAGANGIVGAGGGGGTGGEYAAEPSLAVTPGNNYAYSQGTGGGNTTFGGDSVTVTANGGTAGGTGSANTIHFNGGAHGSGGSGGGGGGGGSSGGAAAAGNAGHNESGTTGGAGGAAVTPGGAGGAGGNASAPGVAGTAPGGAGGGGGKGGAFAGGAGAAGFIRLTYTASGSPSLVASLAASAGTDPNTGDAYVAGMTLIGSQTLIEATSAAAAATSSLLELQGGTGQVVIQAIAAAAATDALEARVSGDTNARYSVNAAGAMGWGPGSAGEDAFLSRAAANLLRCASADFQVHTAGRGLQVAEGSNAKQGVATLAGGTVTVADTSVTANSRIAPLYVTPAANAGAIFFTAIPAGTGFTIKSTNAADTSVVGYEIFEPG
jgi:hypothetical protein